MREIFFLFLSRARERVRERERALKNYKRRPTQLNPYAREFYIHGASALFTHSSRIWVFLKRTKSFLVVGCIFFPFYFCWVRFFPLDVVVAVVIGVVVVFVVVVVVVVVVVTIICIILILGRDQWRQTLSGCQPHFSVLCVAHRYMYVVYVVEIIVLQLQPHTYVDSLVHSPRKRNENR